MKKMLVVLALAMAGVFIYLSQSSSGSTFSADGVKLEMPGGFEGPLTQDMEIGTVNAFTKQSSNGDSKTLLQLSALDLPYVPSDLSTEKMLEGTDQYLLQFLSGVERRRTGFSQGDIEHISLGGAPASKISWNGSVDGLTLNGVMYCVIVGSKVITLHTQDVGNDLTPNMLEAIDAIEALALT